MLKSLVRVLLFCFLLTGLVLPEVWACTGIRIKTEDGFVFYARTMEFGYPMDSGVLVVPKGSKLQGTLPDGSQKGLSWKAKYGFAGMNGMGCPVVIDGLNEAGLAAAGFLFPGYAEYQTYSSASSGSTIAHFDVVNWILANFASVEEVKRNISKVRVCKGGGSPLSELPAHYAVHDAKGQSLVIEYYEGKLHVSDNPLGVLTNSPPFEWMTTYLNNFVHLTPFNTPRRDAKGLVIRQIGQGSGMVGLPGDFTPPSRFVRVAALCQAVLPVSGAEAGLNQAVTIINNVDFSKGMVREKTDTGVEYDVTQWVVISDLGRKRFYFRTMDNKNWHYVDLLKVLSQVKIPTMISIDIPVDYQEVGLKVQ